MWTDIFNNPAPWAPVYFYAISIGMAVLGVWMLNHRVRFYLRSERTIGSVTGYAPERDSDARTGYVQRPIIAFKDRHGRPRQFTGDAIGPDEVLALGHNVPIRYDPDKPDEAMRNNWYLVFTMPIFLCAFGSGLIILLATGAFER